MDDLYIKEKVDRFKRENIRDIEDFESAYYCRKRELDSLIKNGAKNKEILIMHLGGIVIECLVKKMIVYEYSIESTYSSFWYDNKRLEKYIEDHKNENNIMKSKMLKKYGIEYGIHDFIELIKKEYGLNVDLDKMIYYLERIYNPIEIKKRNFIDLRYHNSSSYNIDKFNEWLKAYKSCIKWLENLEIEQEDLPIMRNCSS